MPALPPGVARMLPVAVDLMKNGLDHRDAARIDAAEYDCDPADCLARLRLDLRGRDTHGLIARIDRGDYRGVAVGYAVYQTRRRRRLDVLALIAHPEYRLVGIGALLLGRLCRTLAAAGGGDVTAVVPETEMGALKFCRAVGLRAVRVVPDRWPGVDGIEVRRPVAGE